MCDKDKLEERKINKEEERKFYIGKRIGGECVIVEREGKVKMRKRRIMKMKRN